jgi:Heparinase II/III-like protein/Heparinase II/III N-terminus
MPLTNLLNALGRLRPWGVGGLVVRKIAKRLRYKKMLVALPTNNHLANLKQGSEFPRPILLDSDRDTILIRADAMLRDENIFFTFPYHTQGIDNPWEFDPIENKYWPRRHYTERKLHDHDTPRDVKIVFEINRFKDLLTLGQACLLTGDEKYAIEIERRLLSWIEDNPFALSVNWSSSLEISIRLISWTATLLLLKKTGFNICDNPRIQRSIYEQVCYLAADLGTDKVISTNHLIGEATGLYITASLWEFNNNGHFAQEAQRILEHEIIKQTFPDGVTQEASSWYHQFVTHFFDLVDRISTRRENPFSEAYQSRLSKMKAFLNSMTIADKVVRYGDADDGWALFLEADNNSWKRFMFGPSSATENVPVLNYYPTAKLIVAYIGEAFLFLRAGAFGMGGAGFSSHAHDDFLSPIIYLAGIPVLVDPGTFVYSGDPEKRMLYRKASAHNGLVFGTGTGAIPRKQFGWEQIRPDAIMHETMFKDSEVKVTASYGEWPQHQRTITMNLISALIEDRFMQPIHDRCEWRLHLASEWMVDETPEPQGRYHFRTNYGDRLSINIDGTFETISIESYDYSPSYLVAQPGIVLRLIAPDPTGIYSIHISIDKGK